MWRFAIVEDNETDALKLKECIYRYFHHDCSLAVIDIFDSSTAFLQRYSSNYNAIFMDIEMPSMNGLDVSRKIREVDKNVIIVFVTSIVQYAVEGYAVNVFDCLIKPFTYETFEIKMQRIVEHLNKYSVDDRLILKTSHGAIQIPISSIYYVEVLNHNLIYRLEKENIQVYGKLSAVEATLLNKGFFKSNRCYLVNLRHVKGFSSDLLLEIGDKGEKLLISRRRKADLLKALTSYLGGI